jgi:flagellar hook-associated protein 3 FlgL
MMFSTATSQLGTLQTQMAKTQMQLSTNRRIITPADDPIASAQALGVTQLQAMNTQFATNRAAARSSLSQVEGALASTGLLIQDMQQLGVQAGNGSLTDIDRAAIATELEGRLQDLLGIANSTDGAGGYLFSGYKADSQPFTLHAGGATYNGDQGQRELQVGASRRIAISDSGSSIFENNRNGNGRFNTLAASGNTGSGVISSGVVTDSAAYTGNTYRLDFSVGGSPAATTYTVTNTSTGVTAAPAAYQDGQPIVFDGMSFDIKGAPADGDEFTVEPSSKESLFSTVTSMIALLRTEQGSPAARAQMSNGMNTATENLSAALDNVLTVRASVGSRLKELDYLDSAGEDLGLQYASTLSDLQDLDLVEAISMYSQQQVTLEAAQKSFKSMSSLSLFNYI